MHLLRPVFEFALRELKAYCQQTFDALRREYQAAQVMHSEIATQLSLAGDDMQNVRRIRNRERAMKRRYRVPLQLFEEDYPQFQHDQAYAGTQTEAHFEDIFVTNTAYIALTKLFFVRICEDMGLTTRKVSHEGPGLWSRFVEHIKHQYKDLLQVASRDTAYVYSRLFEPTVFDWYGAGNGQLNGILERVLLRFNAFSFARVDRDLLGTVYQYFRPRAERKRLGEYYTPEEVVDYILHRCGITTDAELMSHRILDPACGSFTFGVRAAGAALNTGQHLTPRNKIALIQRCLTGRDINPFSVFLSHLSLLFTTLDVYRTAKDEDADFRITGFDVANLNSLAVESGQSELAVPEVQRGEALESESFDYVVGNPPFIRNERIPEEDRAALEANFRDLRSGNTDMATYFLASALQRWLRDDGVLGMVAPLAQANAKNAAPLRTLLAGYSLFEIVSLEWMAKEIFPDADIIPMLLFVRKQPPPPDHRITVVSGLKSRKELTEATEEGPFRATHVSELDYAAWLSISPTGDWPLDVTSRDMPILQKLSAGPRLQEAAAPGYGIKLGKAAQLARLRDTEATGAADIAFAKGQHLCAFGLSEPEEVIDLSRIQQAADASIWGDLTFYQANEGRRNESGLNGALFTSNSLLQETLPSDTLCCFVPQVYTALLAAVADPLRLSINNSAMVIVPRLCSAHVLAAVINSRTCRYYAFLTMRAAILLRRRSTWYPRALKNLPWPTLDAPTALTLHTLAIEAAELSARAQDTETGIYLAAMQTITEREKAGFLGVYLQGVPIDAADLAAATPTGNTLAIEESVLHAPDADLLLLARLAALAAEPEEFDNQQWQDLVLPARPQERTVLAGRIRALSGQLAIQKARMEAIADEIDLLVAAGLRLTPAEHAVIVSRCQEFPLSVTVGRPRYVWNADRKVQARRIYESGARFRDANVVREESDDYTDDL